MLNDSGNIEDLFGKAFRNAEETPPNSLWDKLETSLNEDKVESIYKKAFAKATNKPSGKVWKRISLALLIRGFFRFNPKTINAYYLGLASIIGIVALNTGSNTKETELPAPPEFSQIEKALDSFEATTTTASSKQENSSPNLVDKQELETQDATIKVDTQVQILQPTIDVPVSKANVQSVEEIAFYDNLKNSKFAVVTEVCQNTEFDVVLDGLPKDYSIVWDFGSKDAKTTFTFENKASAVYTEEGEKEYTAKVTFGKYSYNVKNTISVKAATKPEIIGPDKICEGSTARFKIDAKHDKNIEYVWESFEGNVLKDANRYTDVTAEVPGVDTIFAIKINKISQCKTEGFAIFNVSPAPKADFIWAPMGEGTFEFKYTGVQQKGNSYTWSIEGDKETGAIVEYSSDSRTVSPVTLEVKNRKGCSNTVTYPVSFNKYVIVMPSVYQVQSGFGTDGLKPHANTALKTYKIEIFDMSNTKIWESTELDDGMPTESWDGTNNGLAVVSGKYLWRITAEFSDGVIWRGTKHSSGECKPEGVVIVKN